MPAQSLVNFPSGSPTSWMPIPGAWKSPWDNQPLSTARDAQGNAIEARWDQSTGGYRLQDGSILGQPRVALAGTGVQTGTSSSPYGSPNYLPTAGTGTTPSVGGWPTGSAFGGASASGGVANPIEVLRNTKNPALDSANQALLGDYNTQRTATKSAVQNFNDRFDESAGMVKKNLETDLGFLNSRRDGTILNQQLTQLAGREAPLRDQLAQNAALIAGRINSAQLQRGGGGSSLLRAEQQQALNESLIPFRLQQYDMGTGYRDANYAAQAATIGMPTQLQDAYNARAYIPSNMSRAALAGDAGFLPGMIANDNAANTYSYRQPNSAFGSYTYTGLPTGGGPAAPGRPSTMPFPQQGGGGGGYVPNRGGGGSGGAQIVGDRVINPDGSLNYLATNAMNFNKLSLARPTTYGGGGGGGGYDTGVPGFDQSGYPMGDYNYDPGYYGV